MYLILWNWYYVQEPDNGAKSLTTSKVLDVELRPASLVTDIKLTDDFTDEYEGVEDLYEDINDYKGEVGNQPLGETATELSNGLTNDATPTIDFTLDSPLLANQEIVLTRYTLTGGTEGDAEVIELPKDATTDGINYTYTESEPLPETYGQDYRYKVEIKTDGETVASRDFDFHLDTMVEGLSVVSANVDPNEAQELVLTTAGTSEVGGSITYSYPSGAGVEERTVKMADDGTFTLKLEGFNRFSNEGLTYTLVDAAGNASDSKTLFLRNMFSQISTEVGPDPSTKVDGTGKNLGGFDDGYRTGAAGSPSGGIQPTTGGEEGGFVATDGNDTFILGLDNFNGQPGRNGSLASATGTNAGQIPFIFDTGAGDDHIVVRDNIFDFNGTEGPGKLSMGQGNDKLDVEGNIVDGTVTLDMGEGNNIIHVQGDTNARSNVTYQFGSGNDLLRVDGNLDGTSTIEFGEGQNKLVARTLKLTPSSTVNYGSGDDVLLTSGDVYGNGADINMGDGNNTVKVGGSFQTNFDDDQLTAQLATVTTGIGNDVFRINGDASMNIDSGAGEDSIRVDNDFNKGTITTGAKAADAVASDNDYVRIDGTAGTLTNAISINTAAEEGYQGTDDDTVRIDGNFINGNINTGDGVDTIQINGSMSSGATLGVRPSIDTGAGDDVLTVKDQVYRANINMGEGNDTLILQSEVSNLNNGRIDMGAGNEDTVMLQGGNVTYHARHFQNVNTFDMTEDTKQTLELQIDDILNDDVKELFIKGDGLDVVDLGANGNGLSDNKIGRENGVWNQKSDLHTDTEGNTYHAYFFTGNDGSVNDEIVYIQDTITVI